jgi:phospholipid/cholesterol/gamma-HCH transport system substrate-binding protein
MTQARLERTVGVFVLTGLAAVAWLAIRIGAGSLGGADTYLVHARFANATGVSPGSNVLVSGVTIGRVDKVRLDPDTFAAIVDMHVRTDVRLPTDSIVSVKTSGLIGDKYLAVRPGADPETVAPGGMLTETESTVDIESLISRLAFGGVKDDKEAKP